MKIVNFKKTAAGIMSVAMMLSATVLPGTVENLPAISNVLTASADDTDPNAGGTTSDTTTSVTKTITCYKDGNTTHTCEAVISEEGTTINISASAVNNELVKSISSENLPGPITIRTYNDSGYVMINENTFNGMNIDHLIISKGTSCADGAFNNCSIKELTIEYFVNISFPNRDDYIFDGAIANLKAFTFSAPTHDGYYSEYVKFQNEHAVLYRAIVNSGATMNVPADPNEPSQPGQDLPEGVKVSMNVEFGYYVGGSFKVIASKDKYVRFTFSTKDASVESAYQNQNYVYEINPGNTQTIKFYVSPKNMASPIRYTVETSNDGLEGWTKYKEGTITVEQYLRTIYESTETDLNIYRPFIAATLVYGSTSQKYFATVGAKITGAQFASEETYSYKHSVPAWYPEVIASHPELTNVTIDNWCTGDEYFFDRSSITDYIGISLMLEAQTRFRVHNKASGASGHLFESPNIAATELGVLKTGTISSTMGNGETFTYCPMMWVNSMLEKHKPADINEIPNLSYQMAYALKQFAWEALILKYRLGK